MLGGKRVGRMSVGSGQTRPRDGRAPRPREIPAVMKGPGWNIQYPSREVRAVIVDSSVIHAR